MNEPRPGAAAPKYNPAKFVRGFRVKPLTWALAQCRLGAVWIPAGGYADARGVVVFP